MYEIASMDEFVLAAHWRAATDAMTTAQTISQTWPQKSKR